MNLIVDGFVKVLDEYVALTSLPQGGVTLRPHDAARDGDELDVGQNHKNYRPSASFNQRVV